jgi:hypothetical protein
VSSGTVLGLRVERLSIGDGGGELEQRAARDIGA